MSAKSSPCSGRRILIKKVVRADTAVYCVSKKPNPVSGQVTAAAINTAIVLTPPSVGSVGFSTDTADRTEFAVGGGLHAIVSAQLEVEITDQMAVFLKYISFALLIVGFGIFMSGTINFAKPSTDWRKFFLKIGLGLLLIALGFAAFLPYAKSH